MILWITESVTLGCFNLESTINQCSDLTFLSHTKKNLCGHQHPAMNLPSFGKSASEKKKKTPKPIRFVAGTNVACSREFSTAQGALRNDGKLCRWVYLATCSHHHHLGRAPPQGWEMTSQTISICSPMILQKSNLTPKTCMTFCCGFHTSPARSAFLVSCLIGVPSFCCKAATFDLRLCIMACFKICLSSDWRQRVAFARCRMIATRRKEEVSTFGIYKFVQKLSTLEPIKSSVNFFRKWACTPLATQLRKTLASPK